MNNRHLLSLLNKARSLSVRLEKATQSVFGYLNDCGLVPDETIPTQSSCNASNLEEAITCCIDYGESTTEGIVEDCVLALKAQREAEPNE